jgi:hypothetical protein
MDFSHITYYSYIYSYYFIYVPYLTGISHCKVCARQGHCSAATLPLRPTEPVRNGDVQERCSWSLALKSTDVGPPSYEILYLVILTEWLYYLWFMVHITI